VSSSYDIIVVGGGAVGAACARELARSGRRVALVERGQGTQGTGWEAAAGMLAAQVESREEDPLFDFALAGRERYRELGPELRQATGIDTGLWFDGLARLALDEADVDELRSRVAWQRQRGQYCDWLDDGEVRARWPWLGPCLGALWAPGEGALDPVRLVQALRADAARHGAVLLEDEIGAIEFLHGRAVAARGRERHAGGGIVIAAGAWSGLIDGLPRPLAVAPVRGQMAALPWPAGVPPTVVYAKDRYVTWRDDVAVVGSTMENAGYRAEVTSDGLESLLASAERIAPAFAGLRVQRSWAGLRPMTPDGLPIIGREPRVDGLWYATGHGRNGILLAAITGLVIAQLVEGTAPAADLGPMRPERFWRW